MMLSSVKSCVMSSSKVVYWLGRDELGDEHDELLEFVAEVKEWQKTHEGWPVDRLDLSCQAFELVFILSESDPEETAS